MVPPETDEKFYNCYIKPTNYYLVYSHVVDVTPKWTVRSMVGSVTVPPRREGETLLRKEKTRGFHVPQKV